MQTPIHIKLVKIIIIIIFFKKEREKQYTEILSNSTSDFRGSKPLYWGEQLDHDHRVPNDRRSGVAGYL